MRHRRYSKKVDGYDSAAEAKFAKQLKDHGLDEGREAITLPYTSKYIPDFVPPALNGVVFEVKGAFPPEDRAKMRAVKLMNPDVDIRIVFSNASRKYGKTMTYAKWCEKNGFPYCNINNVPERWFTL